MFWSWSKLMSAPYPDELRSIDEKLVRLLAERQNKEKGIPDKEQISRWAKEYELEPQLLNWLFYGLFVPHHPIKHTMLGELIGVVPLMKKMVVNGCEYILTHCMQYDNASEVHLDIRIMGEEASRVSVIRPQLTLSIGPEDKYSVSNQGFQGGGGAAKMRFLVTPPLEQDIGGLTFSLVPHYDQPVIPPKEKVLDQQVIFDV